MRDVTAGLLSYMGCRVGFAANGRDGLAQYQRAFDSGEPYDAVILDLSLSGNPNAEETYQKLKQLDSRARVVGSTSDASDPAMEAMLGAGLRALLSRPFQADQLAEVLHKALHDIDSLHKQRT
ncbi:MAG: response regulator [candidate division WOR-3 bacterium]